MQSQGGHSLFKDQITCAYFTTAGKSFHRQIGKNLSRLVFQVRILL